MNSLSIRRSFSRLGRGHARSLHAGLALCILSSLGATTGARAATIQSGSWLESGGQDESMFDPAYVLQMGEQISSSEVTIELISTDEIPVDGYLYSIDKSDDTVFADDNSGGEDFDALISMPIEAEGNYMIVATTNQSGQNGNFDLLASEGVLNGHHLLALTKPGQGREQLYYDKIDQYYIDRGETPRTTSALFRELNGFPGREHVATYYNKLELGLGREQHCVKFNGRVACYVTNYGTPGIDDHETALVDAAARTNFGATVSMEWDPEDLENTVKFYVFNQAGERVGTATLDTEGTKSSPALCLNCHGGAYDPATDSIKGARFIPFIADGFLYSEEPGFTFEDQADELKELNKLIYETVPEDDRVVAEYLDGSYGGDIFDPDTEFDPDYVAEAWATNQNDIDVYQQVHKGYCRTCHIVNGINFEDKSEDSPGFPMSPHTLRHICQSSNSDHIVERVMPQAKLPDDRFWRNQPALLLAFGSQQGIDDCMATRFPADRCPGDPTKNQPGLCGCGVAETDGDGDQAPDCVDECPQDPSKSTAGECGCGVEDVDSDGDGTADCNDACPADPEKSEEGACGCGVADSDTDGDGTADCIDACVDDPEKTEEGACGCGTPDDDSDADGSADCIDSCPDDPNKVEEGTCGCGVEDADAANYNAWQTHTAYQPGQRVSHEGVVYEATLPSNVTTDFWNPGNYNQAWRVIECEGQANVESWSANQSYSFGDLVIHDGHIWRCIHTNSDPGWEPGDPALWSVWQDEGAVNSDPQ